MSGCCCRTRGNHPLTSSMFQPWAADTTTWCGIWQMMSSSSIVTWMQSGDKGQAELGTSYDTAGPGKREGGALTAYLLSRMLHRRWAAFGRGGCLILDRKNSSSKRCVCACVHDAREQTCRHDKADRDRNDTHTRKRADEETEQNTQKSNTGTTRNKNKNKK